MDIEVIPKRTMKEKLAEKWMAIADYFKQRWTIKDWLAWIGGAAIVTDIVILIIRLIRRGSEK